MIIKNILKLFFGRVVLIIIQFASLLITNRLLGSEGRGTFASATTWATLFFTFFFLSINTMYLKECADNKGDKDDLKNGFFTFGILLSVASIVISILAYLFFNDNFIKLPLIIYLINIFTIPFMIIQSLSIAVYQSSGDFKKVNIATLFTSAFNLILIILSIFFVKFDVVVFSTISLISWCCCCLYCFVTCRFSFSWPGLNKLFYKKFVSDLSFLHINTIMTFLVSGLNIIIMHKYLSDNVVGQFFLANAIIGYLLILPASIQNVLITNLIDKTNVDRIRTTGTFFKVSVTGMALIVLVLFFFANIIILVLGGKSFANSGFYLQCLLPTVLFQIAGMIWSSLWSIKGYFKLVMKNSFLIVILSVVLNFILIRSMGVMGAIISINIITFLSMCVHIILAMREFKSVGISAHEIIPQKKDFVTVKESISLFRDKFRK